MTDPREMQAGPELDALIARDIFDYEIRDLKNGIGLRPTYSVFKRVPLYSSDPSASAELRARLWEMGFEYEINAWRSKGQTWIEVLIKHEDLDHSITESVIFAGPDPRQAEFLAVARCGLEAVQKRKGAKA